MRSEPSEVEQYRDLAARIRSALDRTGGLSAPELQPLTESDLRSAERRRSVKLPDDLQAMYLGIGWGFLGWIEILHPEDRYNFDRDIRDELQMWRDEGLFGRGTKEGDSPNGESLSFGYRDNCYWIYEVGGQRPGRIVVFNAGLCGRRKSWTAAMSLQGFVTAMAEIVEFGGFRFQPETYDAAPYADAPTGMFAPDDYREILERNGATGAVLGDAGAD